MPKKILPLVFFTSFYLFSLISLYNYLNQKITILSQIKKACEETSTQSKLPEISLNDIFLYAQKTKTVVNSSFGKMYFSSKKIKTGENLWQVEFTLQGSAKTLTDAADLQLDFDQNIEIMDILPGDAFPMYPRKIITNKSLIITGASSIDRNTVTFGQPNKIFAVVILRKKSDDNIKQLLFLNPNGTKIYFSAQNILDTEKNFTQIEI